MPQKALLKFSYNDMRSYKYDCSYFDEELVDYILDKNQNEPKSFISIFAGLAVNISPLSSFLTNNMKILWNKDPVFLSKSMIRFIDYSTGNVILEDDNEKNEIEDMMFSYIFRLNSFQFIIVFWDKNSCNIDKNSKLFEIQYPYTKLSSDGSSKLSRCTNGVNFYDIMLVNLNWDLIDEFETIQQMCQPQSYEYKKISKNCGKKKSIA